MIGEVVSHYRIVEELGSGGLGTVYKAEDTRLKGAVALKFLASDQFRDKDSKARFLYEPDRIYFTLQELTGRIFLLQPREVASGLRH